MSNDTTPKIVDPDVTPPLGQAIPLGIQHVLAMFAGNVTVPLIVAGIIGSDAAEKAFLIQAAIFVGGVATLVQTVGIGPLGARLPIVMGTSFAFVPVMIPFAAESGLAAVFAGGLVAGVTQLLLGPFVLRVRHLFPPVVTGTVVLTIGLLLLPVGINYAAGGYGAEDFGAWHHLSLAILVVVVIGFFHATFKGFWSAASILMGLIAGYLVAIPMGLVDFGSVGNAGWASMPTPLTYGFEFSGSLILVFVIMGFVTSMETMGDISGVAMGGPGREATGRELRGGVLADGVGTVFGALFNAMPNTTYSQNVGLVALTGIASRHVVTIGAIFLVIMGLFPKVAAIVSAMPPAVLGGAAVLMFGAVAVAGLKLIARSELNRRNMFIVALSISLAVGLKQVPGALDHLPDLAKTLLGNGIMPAAVLAFVLNLILPERDTEE